MTENFQQIHHLHRRLIAMFFVMIIAFGVTFGPIVSIVPDVLAVSPPNIISYQGRILNDGAVPIGDATADMAFEIYDGDDPGLDTCLWSNDSDDCNGGAGSAVDQTVDLTDGLFSENLGDVSEGYAAIPDSLFADNDELWLRVFINGEDLVPLKRITAQGYALNADFLDGFDSSQTGGTTAFVPATDATGNLQLTGDPQGSTVADGSLYVNPATPGAGETIFGVGNAGTTLFMVDAEGDTIVAGTLAVNGDTITAAAVTDLDCADCIDFDDLDDTMELDASTSITLDGAETLEFSHGSSGDISFDLTSTGDLVIEDGGVAFATFDDGGDLTLANDLTVNGSIFLDVAGTDIDLESSAGATTSGAFAIGAFDEFDNSTGTNVQDVLDDLDASITSAAGNDLDAAYDNDVDGILSVDGLDLEFSLDAAGADFIVDLQSTGDFLVQDGGADVLTIDQDGISEFEDDVNLTFGGLENLAVTSTTGDNAVDVQTITITNNDTTAATQRGLVIVNASDAAVSTTESLIALNNADANGVTDAIVVTGSGGPITDAIDVSGGGIINALNVGGNFIVGTTPEINFTDFTLTTDGHITTEPDEDGTGLLIQPSGTVGVFVGVDVSDSDIDTALAFGDNDIDGSTFDVTGLTGDVAADGTVTAGDFSCFAGDCLDFTELEDTLDLDAALTLNQGTNTWTQNFTGTTTTGFTYNANSLTSGTAVNVFSSSPSFSGVNGVDTHLVRVNHDADFAADTTTLGGDVVDLFQTYLVETALADLSVPNSLLYLQRDTTTNNASATIDVSGPIMAIYDYSTVTSGSITNSGQLLQVVQNFATAIGSLVQVQNAGTGFGVEINNTGDAVNLRLDTTATTADMISTPAIATLTTGSFIDFSASSAWSDALVKLSSSGAATGNFIELSSSNAGATAKAIDIDFETSTETQDIVAITTDFSVSENEVFRIEADGEVFSDIGFTAGASTNYRDGTITDSDANADDLFTFSLADGADTFQVTTGNLRVGSGATPGVALGGEDAFIEGTLEVDGIASFGGTVDALDFSCTGGDCLDFDSFEDTLNLDAATTVALSVNDFTINLDSTGEFAVQDGGSDVFRIEDANGISTFSDDVDMTFAGSEELTVSSNPTADAGVTTNGMDLILTIPTHSIAGTNIHRALFIDPDINTNNPSAGTNTVNLIDIDALTGDAQVTLRGINIGALTGTGATETAINIGAGWDTSITAAGSISAGDFTCTDCLDFTEFANSLTIDETTTINSAGTTFTIQDGTMDVALDAAQNFTVSQCSSGCGAAHTAIFRTNFNGGIEMGKGSSGYTPTTGVDISYPSISTGTGLSLDVSAISSGTGMRLDHDGGNLTGDLFLLSQVGTTALGAGGDATGNLLDVTSTLTTSAGADTRTFSGALQTITRTHTDNGNGSVNITSPALAISASTTDSSGGTTTISGSLVSITSGVTTDGALTDTATLLSITQNFASATGAAIAINSETITTTTDIFQIVTDVAAIDENEVFLIEADGEIFSDIGITINDVTLADDTITANAISLASGDNLTVINGAICVDNDGSCTSLTAGEVRADAFPTTGGDVAEMYYSSDSLQAADVVSLDTSQNISVRKTTAANDTHVIGVVATDPGVILAANGAFNEATRTSDPNYYPIALVGRVPVNVSAENGAIAIGDPLTSATTDGYAMKANEPGVIIGFALEAHSSGFGNITAYIAPHWSAGDVISSDGSSTIISDQVVMNSLGTANAATSYDSNTLSLAGSGWNGSAATELKMNLTNVVDDGADTYRLSVTNNDGTEVAYVGQDGDLAVSGRFYPSDRGTLQTDKYIFYDGSGGGGGDRMRTNAAGWGTGSYDFAEMFPSSEKLEPGDTVVFSGDGEHIRRSSEEYDEHLAGIISTQPGFLAGENNPGDYPLALSGRVPTKVTNDNGSIEVGDPLTSSSRSGYAMKATEPGQIVGYALEPSDDKTDTIIVFVRGGYWGGGETSEVPGTENTASQISSSSSVSSLSTDGNIYLNGNEILNVSRLSGISDNWSIEEDGTFVTTTTYKAMVGTTQGDQAEVFAAMSPEVTIQLSGTAQLSDGRAVVEFEDVDPSFNDIISTVAGVRVLVTPNGATGVLFVSDKDNNGFTVEEIGGSPSDNVTFDWLVIAYRNGYEPVEELDLDEPVVEEVGAIQELPADEPVTDEPVAEEVGAIQELPTDEPVTDEPVAEEVGAIQELPAEEPVTDEPVAEEVGAIQELPAEEPAA